MSLENKDKIRADLWNTLHAQSPEAVVGDDLKGLKVFSSV